MWNEGRFRRLIDCYLLINEYIFDYFDYDIYWNRCRILGIVLIQYSIALWS